MSIFTPLSSSKRNRVGGITVAAAVAITALAGCAPTAAPAAAPAASAAVDSTPKPTVVMVHGAWSDASPFDAVGDQLREAGYTVVNFANPLRALGTDTAYLNAFLEARTEGPVVLVGHSYGGAVIGGAAVSDPDVKALVYLNAFVPEVGETILDLAAHGGPVDAAALFDMAEFPGDHNVDLYLKAEPFAGGFANGLTDEQSAEYFAKQRPITYAALSEPAGEQAWATLPSWYVAGTEDHSIDIDTQRFMAERAGSTVTELKASHLTMVADSDAVTDVIKDAATATK
ncbi:alpha/beta fold hydrolase [Cryobacterium sp. N22]|uniref:alpha/beta fold hydrolase n=1 Tax=Cryobacterium sp. N22 TaxID=2048290 RepID=UPI000CE43019|nr:alpha/beta hydrolase [Cryobacterium sp. N22]